MLFNEFYLNLTAQNGMSHISMNFTQKTYAKSHSQERYIIPSNICFERHSPERYAILFNDFLKKLTTQKGMPYI